MDFKKKLFKPSNHCNYHISFHFIHQHNSEELIQLSLLKLHTMIFLMSIERD